MNKEVFDLSDYFATTSQYSTIDSYKFLDSSITDIFQQQPGQDVSKEFAAAMAKLDPTKQAQTYNCLKNNFYYGRTDFRDAVKCHVADKILLAFAIVLSSTIVIKCGFFC